MCRREFLSGLTACAGVVGVALRRGQDAVARMRERILQVTGDVDWEAFRREFVLDPEVCYLNTGSAGCTPASLLDAVHRAGLELERNPFDHLWRDGMVRAVEGVRANVCAFFGAAKDELALTENTTAGLAALASGIDWSPRDEVVLTTHEHLSCLAVWKYFQKRYDLVLRYVDVPVPDYSDDEFLRRFAGQLTDRTRVCCISHIDSYTGIRLPMDQVALLVRPRKILFVCDAAQSLGMQPVNLETLEVDALVGSGHKWLMGTKGTGLLCLRRDAQERIKPLAVDWSFAAMTPCTGTRNLSVLLGWQSVLDMQSLLGGDRIANRIEQLRNLLEQRLAEDTKLTPCVHQREGAARTGLAAFRLPEDRNSAAIADRLAREFRIEVKPLPPTCELEPSLQRELNAIRISTHVFNNEAEIDRLVTSLQRLL
jgi:selenocysteine lyase/cysteine desulfurase